MVNYKNGKVYRLVSPSGKQYVGSTTQPLSKRLHAHKYDYKRWKSGKTHYVTSFELFESEKVEVILIEDFPCDRKEQLHARERYYVEQLDCVNKCVPTRTKKEWDRENGKAYREKTKDHKNKYNHFYYNKNKGKLLDKVLCECGSEVAVCCLVRHNKSNKHRDFISKK